MLDTIINLLIWAATLGGGIWLVWGAIILAGGLRDQNGPQIQTGVWQVVGGGVIIAAAQIFNQVQTTF
ncbi:MAG: hypothetical protein L0G69_01520 [Brevibacterium sp.]|nr:hypothetical protein [Brevibacterium sp.]